MSAVSDIVATLSMQIRETALGDIQLHRRQQITFGRGKSNDISLDDEDLQEHQCHFWEVTYDDNLPPAVYVRNRSANGSTYVTRKDERIYLNSDPISSKGWLLEPGVEVGFGRFTIKVTQHYVNQKVHKLGEIQQEEARQFRDDFEICDVVLGKGGQGEVRLAWNVRTKEQLVVKIVDLAKMLEVRGPGGINWVNRTRLEAEVLGKLDHYNVIKLATHFRSNYSIFLFLELASGGDLTSYMQRKVFMDEGETQGILRQVVAGLKYIHDRGLVHRDLKPCNILLASIPRGNHRVCISDFGCAGIHASGRLMSGVGTMGYQAPEVQFRTGVQTPSVDMWSLGMVVLDLWGREHGVPDLARSQFEFRVQATQEQVDAKVNGLFASKQDHRSLHLLDFIKRCLRVEPTERMTVYQAVTHPFLRLNEGVFQAMEGIRRKGIPAVTPIVDIGRELLDVLPNSRRGMKALPLPGSDSYTLRVRNLESPSVDRTGGSGFPDQQQPKSQVQLGSPAGRGNPFDRSLPQGQSRPAPAQQPASSSLREQFAEILREHPMPLQYQPPSATPLPPGGSDPSTPSLPRRNPFFSEQNVGASRFRSKVDPAVLAQARAQKTGAAGTTGRPQPQRPLRRVLGRVEEETSGAPTDPGSWVDAVNRKTSGKWP